MAGGLSAGGTTTASVAAAAAAAGKVFDRSPQQPWLVLILVTLQELFILLLTQDLREHTTDAGVPAAQRYHR